jgi:hypothetical protein
VNQLELLHVSAVKAHELTQAFLTPGYAYERFANFIDPTSNTMLYRALAVLGTPNYVLGNVPGGREQGRINLNTITEEEIFQALCDAQNLSQPYSAFSVAEVQAIYRKLITSRNLAPGTPLPVPLNWNPMPSGEGSPLKSFATGNNLDTFFRLDPTLPLPSLPLFTVGSSTGHPYLRPALLQKIFNNVSTTSNVFAVHWTVGYFEVVDESVKPARLGAEIGRAENRHVRNRFFAIVDRSGLQLFNTTTSSAVGAGSNQSVSVTAFTGPLNSGTWDIRVGMLLEVNDAGNPALNEVVVVKSVNGATSSFTADFAFPHAAGVAIVCRGNPGPKTNNTAPPFVSPYNPRADTGVVLHLSVVQ